MWVYLGVVKARGPVTPTKEIEQLVSVQVSGPTASTASFTLVENKSPLTGESSKPVLNGPSLKYIVHAETCVEANMRGSVLATREDDTIASFTATPYMLAKVSEIANSDHERGTVFRGGFLGGSKTMGSA